MVVPRVAIYVSILVELHPGVEPCIFDYTRHISPRKRGLQRVPVVSATQEARTGLNIVFQRNEVDLLFTLS